MRLPSEENFSGLDLLRVLLFSCTWTKSMHESPALHPASSSAFFAHLARAKAQTGVTTVFCTASSRLGLVPLQLLYLLPQPGCA